MKRLFSYLPVILLTILLSVSSMRMCITYYLEQESLNTVIKYSLIFATIFFVLVFFKRIRKVIILVFFLTLFILCNYFFLEENRPYIYLTIGETWQYLVATVLCGFVMSKDDLVKAFTLSACIILLCSILLMQSEAYYRQLTEYEYGGTGAVFSGMLLIPAVVFAFDYKWNKNLLYLIPSIASALIFIVVGGKRMVLISYLFALLYVLFGGLNKKTLWRKMLLFFLIIVSFLFILLPLLSSYFEQNLGIDLYSLRIFNVFSNDRTSTGRSAIYSTLFASIFSFDGIFWGRGMNGDMALRSDHQYSHNLFLELIVEFGLILGLALIAVLFLLLIKVIRKRTEYNQILVFMLFVCFLPLMVSGTFWNSQLFWLTVSICFNILANNNYCVKNLPIIKTHQQHDAQ